MIPTIIAVDWGKHPPKRAAYVSRPQASGFAIAPLDPPTGGWRLSALLRCARTEAEATTRPVLLGIDAVLGLPRAYLARLDTPVDGFLGFLRRTQSQPGLLTASPVGAWTPRAPFFSVPSGEGQLKAIVDAAGGREVFWRAIEARTRGNSVFALSGIPGTVGSGSRALWLELCASLSADRDFAVWPFEGRMADLCVQRSIVLAEVYPRAAYALALSEDLPAAAFGIAKTKPAERARALRQLDATLWWRALNLQIDGQGRAAANEDDFDALFTAIALTRLAATGQLIESPFVDHRCEGDILGVCALTERSVGVTTSRPSPRPSPGPSPTRSRVDPTAQPSFDCPIPNCTHTFNGSRGGWDAHVGSLRRHPRWHPELSDPELRREAFRREFAAWF